MDIATIITLIILAVLAIQVIDYYKPSWLPHWFTWRLFKKRVKISKPVRHRPRQKRKRKTGVKTTFFPVNKPIVNPAAKGKRVNGYSRLSRLVGSKTANRLIDGVAKQNPGHSRDWCIEKALRDYERDRR